MTITSEGLAMIAAAIVVCTALVAPFLVVLTLIQAFL